MHKILAILLLFLPLVACAIDINTAPAEELDKITGIGPALSQRIMEARPFSSLDDLLRVKGIGPATLEKIKEQGLAEIKLENILVPKSPEIKSSEIVYAGNIYFTEIMPSPAGSDEEGEYIKIKNGNDFDVDLSGWKIEDISGTPVPYELSAKLKAFSILTLYRSETKITLNNSGDGLKLTKPDGSAADAVNFEHSDTGIPYIKTASGWKWNYPPAEIKKQPREKGAGPAPESRASLAQIQEIRLSHSEPKTPVIAISLFTASLCAGFVLYLKKKMG